VPRNGADSDRGRKRPTQRRLLPHVRREEARSGSQSTKHQASKGSAGASPAGPAAAGRTSEEIAKEVERLREIRKNTPKKSFFGDDNHAEIDAVIEALEKRMTAEEAERKLYQDESAEEFEDGDNDLYHTVCSAIRWMNGDKHEVAYSAGWQ
jgi:hypothetical protein